MMLEPKIVTHFSHPFVSIAYIKKEYDNKSKRLRDVLVIRPRVSPKGWGRTAYLSFMSDLDLIIDNIRAHEGHVDRVDIRPH